MVSKASLGTNHSKPLPWHPSTIGLSWGQSQMEVGSYGREGGGGDPAIIAAVLGEVDSAM